MPLLIVIDRPNGAGKAYHLPLSRANFFFSLNGATALRGSAAPDFLRQRARPGIARLEGSRRARRDLSIRRRLPTGQGPTRSQGNRLGDILELRRAEIAERIRA